VEFGFYLNSDAEKAKEDFVDVRNFVCARQ